MVCMGMSVWLRRFAIFARQRWVGCHSGCESGLVLLAHAQFDGV